MRAELTMTVVVSALWLLLGSTSLAAHPLHASAVVIDLHDDMVVLQVQLPIDQLELALTTTFSPPATTLVAREGDRIAELVQRALTIVAPGGRPFTLQVQRKTIAVRRIDEVDHFVIDVVATPPTGASPRSFIFTDTAIVDRLESHRIYVEVRHDFAGGVLEQPALIGVLSSKKPSIVVDRGVGSWRHGFAAVFELGVHHIASGTDHLLFLLVLLLPASLRARGGLWREPMRVSSSFSRIIAVVTAFTIGHSLSLALATFEVLTPPSEVIETIIALSILASAAHAVRPVFARREAVVAGVFGLVHGLAFATVLVELGMRGTSLALSLLAFNLGIEVMQLLVVVVTMPWLLLLARTPIGAPVRVLLAMLAGIAAIAWVVERVWAVSTPVSVVVEAAAAQAPWLLLGLAVVSIGATIRQRRRR